MKICFSLFFFLYKMALFSCSIVFIHLGSMIPDHLYYTIKQAYIFNPTIPIYLIANSNVVNSCPKDINVILVACETLKSSKAHEYFKKNTALNRHDTGGLWFYSSERFFYLEELIREKNIQDVFHLENDMLLYTQLDSLLPTFRKNYPNMIAATFEGDFRCVPGFLYIPDVEPLSKMNNFIAESAFRSGNMLDQADMQTIGNFRKDYWKIWIDTLPTVPSEFISDDKLVKGSKEPNLYCNHFEDFHSIFDAASLGVYLAGFNSRYHVAQPKTINPNSYFNPSYGEIIWESDFELRKVPFFIYKNRKIKINNLHLTNKCEIKNFLSK